MQLEKSQFLIQTLFQICRKQCMPALANKKKTNKHKKREKKFEKKKTEMWEARYCDCRCKKRQSETCKNDEDHSALQTDIVDSCVYGSAQWDKCEAPNHKTGGRGRIQKLFQSSFTYYLQHPKKNQKPRIILLKKQAHHSWRVLSGSWFWLEPFGSGF